MEASYSLRFGPVVVAVTGEFDRARLDREVGHVFDLLGDEATSPRLKRAILDLVTEAYAYGREVERAGLREAFATLREEMGALVDLEGGHLDVCGHSPEGEAAMAYLHERVSS